MNLYTTSNSNGAKRECEICRASISFTNVYYGMFFYISKENRVYITYSCICRNCFHMYEIYEPNNLKFCSFCELQMDIYDTYILSYGSFRGYHSYRGKGMDYEFLNFFKTSCTSCYRMLNHPKLNAVQKLIEVCGHFSYLGDFNVKKI